MNASQCYIIYALPVLLLTKVPIYDVVTYGGSIQYVILVEIAIPET
jgi:hypothetical protein